MAPKLTFRLKISFFYVLALIQVLLVGLSVLFTLIIVESLEHWELQRSQAVAKFVSSEANHGTSRVTLAALTVADNKDIAKALAQRDRKRLLALTGGLWKNLQTHGLETFEFSIPTPKGMTPFLRVQAPQKEGEYGKPGSASRPLVEKCDAERKLVHGLEQDSSGYAFRAVTPVFYNGSYAGCMEFGSGLHKGFLKRLDDVHPGAWSIASLDHKVVGALNVSEDDALSQAQAAPAAALAQIRADKFYREADRKTESVSLYIPLADTKSDVALYVKHDFTTNYYHQLRKAVALSATICMLGLLLSSLVIFVLYREINNPIDALVEESEKIRRFELDEPVRVRARLKEIQKLVTAMAGMKTGLSSFKKYVPAQLVRQLIETNQEAKISGQRRELTLLFSDIADFTSISETLKPLELSAQLSEYFNAVTEIIMEERGTVDKYIGDAVMAFWGAPLEAPSHATAACRAALRAQKKIAELNQQWAAQGKPQFYTRIGLNTGEAIVGNMGSEQRLNYTAIGDPVNLASRLEGINKNYKTRVIISQNTYERCKNDMETRILDFVTVKGKSEVVTIYELLAEKGGLSTLDKQFAGDFSAAVELYKNRQWDRAIESFLALSRKRPDDYPSTLFLRRCQAFKATPPAEEWTGVAA